MPRPPAKCGTDGGYYRHLRTTKTTPCQACRKAHFAEMRRRQAGQPPQGEVKLCACGTRMLVTEYDECTYCRRGRVEKAEQGAKIKWRKNTRGVFHAVSVVDPEPDNWPRAGAA